MKKLLYKKNDTNINHNIGSIMYVFYNNFNSTVQTNLIQEKRLYEFEAKDINEFLTKKENEGWVDSDKIGDFKIDPVLDCIEILHLGFEINAKKYIDVFGKYVNIMFRANNNENIEDNLNIFRNIFCELINKRKKIKEKLLSEIYKYAKYEYEYDNYLETCFEEEEQVFIKKCLETKEGVFENLVDLEYIEIEEREKYNKIKFSFDCNWDGGHGVAVSFENFKFNEIGQCGSI